MASLWFFCGGVFRLHSDFDLPAPSPMSLLSDLADRLTAPLDDLIQRPYHPLRWQRKVNVDGQGLPVEVVDDVEQYADTESTTRIPSYAGCGSISSLGKGLISTVMMASRKVTVSCQKTVYTKFLTPSKM